MMQDGSSWIWQCQGTVGGNVDGCVAYQPSSDSDPGGAVNVANCLPFTMPPADFLFASSRKVFANYNLPNWMSADNVAPPNDYWNQVWLNPAGIAQYASQGGDSRTRPISVGAPNPDPNWVIDNFEIEIRQAMARGITAFSYDVFGTDECSNTANSGNNLQNLLTAANSVDPRFKIIIQPDMSTMNLNTGAAGAGPTDSVQQIVECTQNNPAVYKLADGSLFLDPFNAPDPGPGAWQNTLTVLRNEGIPVSFFPTFLNLSPDIMSTYASVADGFGEWSTAGTGQLAQTQSDTANAHNIGKLIVTGVQPQDCRPRESNCWEANNSLGYRDGWMGTISAGADMIMLTTWDDRQEMTMMQPYTDSSMDPTIGTWSYDLTGYYAAWFATGVAPTIDHDVLYWVYRKMSSGAPSPNQSSRFNFVGTGPSDQIELLAFLTAPGTLQITIGGQTQTMNAPAGVTSFTVPLQAGTPQFSLIRGGSTVFSASGFQTYGPNALGGTQFQNGVQDLTYWGGSASAAGTCQIGLPPAGL
jgi:hypothetical protein